MATESLNLWIEDLTNDQVGLRLRLRECLYAANSPFQRIAVFDSVAFGRVLCLGNSIALTDADEALYAEHLVHPALAAMPAAKHVLILGGGDGGVAREVARYAGAEKITVVEIDRQVVEVCGKFFAHTASGLKDPRVELVIDDAHRFLRDTDRQFDVIIVDACELSGPNAAASDVFHDLGFAASVFRRLREGGVLIAPLGCPSLVGDDARATLRTLAEKFRPRVYQMAVPSYPGGTWAVAWCSTAIAPGDQVAPQPWHNRLKSWHPGLQAAQFALPRVVQAQLGLH